MFVERQGMCYTCQQVQTLQSSCIHSHTLYIHSGFSKYMFVTLQAEN